MSTPRPNVARNPSAASGAAGAGASLTAADMSRLAQLDAATSINTGPTPAELNQQQTRQARRREAEAASQNLDRDLRQSIADLAASARESQALQSGRRAEAARLAAQRTASRAEQAAQPPAPKAPVNPQPGVPAAKAPTITAGAQNQPNMQQQGNPQQFAGRDPRDPRSLFTTQPKPGQAAAALAQMTRGRVAEPKLPQHLARPPVAVSVKAKPPTVPAAATPADNAAPKTPAQDAQQLAQSTLGQAIRAGRHAAPRSAEKGSTSERATTDADRIDETVEGNGGSAISSGDTQSDHLRVTRKGGQGSDGELKRALSGFVGTLDDSPTDETNACASATAPVHVPVFGGGTDWRETNYLHARAGFAALMPAAPVAGDYEAVALSRNGLANRVQTHDASIAELLRMQLNTANVRNA